MPSTKLPKGRDRILQGCRLHLRRAGGKLTAAPDGASLEYEVIIPGDGQGDHPSFMLLTEAKEAFAAIGINLIINDPADSNELWNALDAESQELWCAAWGSTIDPDMYQVYHSNNVVGLPGSSESNHYHIQDAELDELIMAPARAMTRPTANRPTRPASTSYRLGG
jgi:peptide/nickel transport system substrate-binding protein